MQPGETVRYPGPQSRPRTVSALCIDGHGIAYAITGRDLFVPDLAEDGGVRLASDLLEVLPLGSLGSRVRPPVPEPADLERQWEDAIYRVAADGSRVLGILKGVRGLVDLKAGNRLVRVAALLEVEFDELGLDRMPSPRLSQGDLGRLLSLPSGQPCGILVAGSGRWGYAVPLKEALAKAGLTLLEIPPTASKIELGYEAFAADVARSVTFNLGDQPALDIAA